MNGSGGYAVQFYLWLLAGAAVLIGTLASVVGFLINLAVRAHLKIDDEFKEEVQRRFERLEDRINQHIDSMKG